MAGIQHVLLTDEQMRKFITEGYLILKTDFSAEFHRQLSDELAKVYKEEGNPGNNLLPRIRELQQVFDHPVVTGALTSVLGPDYMLHAHRHGHYNAQPKAGGWHKDSYWGYDKQRNHHPWWAMVMYFPQDTPPELGPTGIMPGTQNYESRLFKEDDDSREVTASGEAGTFALIHYDIWHRSTPNLLGKSRFMLKFEFMRTAAPTEPTWNNQQPEWKLPAELKAIDKQETMWEETWNWLSGRLGSVAGTRTADEERIRELSGQLKNSYEPAALNAAYELARLGRRGINALLTGLQSGNVLESRVSSYGLSVSGEDAIDGLKELLTADTEETLRHAVFALGEQRHLAARAVPSLIERLNHPSAAVRIAVTEALGMIGSPPEEIVNGLIRCLRDEDTQVRFTAGLSLSRIGPSAASAVPALEEALEDDNRYVRAHAMEALRYIGTGQAKDLLIRKLFNSRWCTTTTPASTFYP
ncbi:HEAT repeat domain-containing protein [Paenibacillus tarimensis]